MGETEEEFAEATSEDVLLDLRGKLQRLLWRYEFEGPRIWKVLQAQAHAKSAFEARMAEGISTGEITGSNAEARQGKAQIIFSREWRALQKANEETELARPKLQLMETQLQVIKLMVRVEEVLAHVTNVQED